MDHRELYEIIKVLEPEQVKFIQDSIKNFRGSKDQEVVSKKLIDYLASSDNLPSESEVMKAVYGSSGSPSRDSFKKLLSRTRIKIIDSIPYDFEKALPEEIDTVRLKLIKRWAVIQFLLIRGTSYRNILTLLEENLSVARSYEFYSLHMELLRLKKQLKAMDEGHEAVLEINKEISQSERARIALDLAVEYNNLFRFKNAPRLIRENQKALGETLLSQIRYLNGEYKATQSVSLLYNLLMLQLEYNNLINDYKKSGKILLKLLHIVEHEKAVKSKRRIGFIYLYLGLNEVHLEKFKSAISYLQKVKGYFGTNNRNYISALGMEAESYFYLKDYSKAEEIFSTLFKTGEMYIPQAEYARYYFLQINILILKKRYKQAFNLLNHKKLVSKDKTGWDFWTRVLNIVLFVLLKNEDSASRALENLKKQISRVSKTQEFNKRDLIVFEILNTMYKNGFSLTKKECNAYLKMLKNSGTSWKLFTPEVLPFEDMLKFVWEGSKK